MTTAHEASRTLVKSPPELWAECSEAGSLARHLGRFGEITITRLEPESTVAWEGSHASGTVRIEPSGWGTRVTLTAQTKRGVLETPVETAETPAEEVETPVREVETVATPVGEVAAATGGMETPVGESESRSTDDQCQAAADGSRLAGPEAADGSPEPPGDEPLTAKEDEHATVEETLEDPGPVLASNSRPPRFRWRRVTTRWRRMFGPDPARMEQQHPVSGFAGPVRSVAMAEAESATAPPEPAVESAPPAPEPESVLPEPAGQHEPIASEHVATEGLARAEVTADPAPTDSDLDAEAILASALDSLGQAHHRPFSRA